MADADAGLRERILSEIVRLDAEDGRPPGIRRFQIATRINLYAVMAFWPTWSEAIAAAGLTPNSLNQSKSEDALLSALAELTRKLGKMPTYRRIVYEAKNGSGFLNHGTLTKHFGNKDGWITALRTWVSEKPEFWDVALILGEQNAQIVTRNKSSLPEVEIASLSDSYLPPIVASLDALGRGEPAIAEACKTLGRDESAEFERRVAIAFEIIGLKVERMGQGFGRVADGIARCNAAGWALIYDAKLRRDRYRLLTEDRKFREYVETHAPALRATGINRIYFAVVSNEFSEADLERAHELVRVSDVKSCVFLETSALVAIVDDRIRRAGAFDLDDVEKLLTRTRILGEKSVRPARR